MPNKSSQPAASLWARREAGLSYRADPAWLSSVGDLKSMNPQIPESQKPLQTKSIAQRAAKASWVCTVIIWVLVTVGYYLGLQLIVEPIALLLMIAGIVLGIIALFGFRRHGPKDILGPALAGILMNSALIFIFVTNFTAARSKALRERQGAALNKTLQPTAASPRN